jgi:cyclic pyranopterin phosphate synthase
MSGELTHLDAKGQAQMVDVSQKQASDRTAIAEGRVVMSPETFQVVLTGQAKKGDVLGVARLAGIMAAKRTSDLIPLCHPLPLAKVAIDLEADARTHSILVVATAKVSGQTGVEMEALTAVSVACLTVYDMVKAVDKGMRIEGIRLLEKTGGKSGTYKADK